MASLSDRKYYGKVKFLGGTKEVGRSALALKVEDTCVLLDYGVMINHEPGFPVHISPKEVNGIILSHAHLDHCGGVPLFHIGGKVPVYGTRLTFEISRLLIADFINLSGYYLPYEFLDLDTMIRSTVNIEYNNTFSVRNLKFKLLDAGHIPGSAQIDVELESNHHLVYTGDINLSDTKLLRGAFTGYSDLSCIIVEATYANEDHPNRKELERQFVLKIREVVERGGTVLVPAFSVGRSQEILSILAENNLEYPILVDGMALQVNEIMLQHPNYFRDYPLLRRSLEGVKWISRWRERKEAAKTPGVIVSPAGMLKGGPAAFYVEKVAKQKKNAILLVSFQIPGTPGRVLLYEKKVFIKGKAKRVEAEVERYDFSSHCGKSDLEAFLRNLKSNPTVFVVHGSEENCKSLAEYAKKEVGLESIVPSAGEVYKV